VGVKDISNNESSQLVLAVAQGPHHLFAPL
jgi:hypothetical protein